MTNRGRAYILLLLLVSCLLLFWLGKSGGGGIVHELSLLPLRSLLMGAKSVAGAAAGALSGGKSSSSELRELRREVAKLGVKVAQLKEAKRENEILRSLLGVKQDVKGRVILCNVIGRSPSNWFRTLTIDVGKRKGIEKRTVVMDGKGLVGQVYRVNLWSADVLMLTDQSSGVGAKIERSGTVGVVRGQSLKELLLTYLSPGADVNVGDEVITSGLGGVYPRGLPIGKVKSVHKDEKGSSISAVVIPSANLQQLELLVLLKEEKSK